MDDTDEPAFERYGEAAERLRELAEQTSVRDIQADLLSLADYFDRMAAQLKTQRSPGERSNKHNPS
jgi:molecular chaperone GrpE (heat shock protein)